MEACSRGNFDIVEFLVEKGAHVDEFDKKCWSPITYCASIGNVKIAKYLLNKGGLLADPDHADGKWDTPLSVACARSKIEFVKWLISFGLQEVYTDDEIQVACNRAVEAGKKNLVKMMVEQGSSVSFRQYVRVEMSTVSVFNVAQSACRAGSAKARTADLHCQRARSSGNCRVSCQVPGADRVSRRARKVAATSCCARGQAHSRPVAYRER